MPLMEILTHLLSYIYYLKPPNRVRDRSMKVLCLGLSRSGTDSLRKALKELGYDEVYHAFVLFGWQIEDAVLWSKLMQRKLGNGQSTRAELDKMLGQCEAVTDFPCSNLADDLLSAYPDAKVILNQRTDIEAWHRSMISGPLRVQEDWSLWFYSFFDPYLFWRGVVIYLGSKIKYNNDIRHHGKQAALKHYQELEKILQEDRRPYLKWSVEDGWAPLCAFLEKPVPDTPFPRGNQIHDLLNTIKGEHQPRIARARKNMLFLFVIIVPIAAWMIGTRKIPTI